MDRRRHVASEAARMPLPGAALAKMSRKIGRSDADVEALEGAARKPPAEPMGDFGGDCVFSMA